MSGETEQSVSGWTVDTLKEYVIRAMSEQRDNLAKELAAQRDFATQQRDDMRSSGRMQVEDLRDSTKTQAEDHRRLLDERYATQTKALDAAFKAAEQAVAVALANAEKATTKAESAADSRFGAVNEFRQTLADQTATFLPRSEYETARNALVELMAANADRVSALELRLTSRLDLGQGQDTGTSNATEAAAVLAVRSLQVRYVIATTVISLVFIITSVLTAVLIH